MLLKCSVRREGMLHVRGKGRERREGREESKLFGRRGEKKTCACAKSSENFREAVEGR